MSDSKNSIMPIALASLGAMAWLFMRYSETETIAKAYRIWEALNPQESGIEAWSAGVDWQKERDRKSVRIANAARSHYRLVLKNSVQYVNEICPDASVVGVAMAAFHIARSATGGICDAIDHVEVDDHE